MRDIKKTWNLLLPVPPFEALALPWKLEPTTRSPRRYVRTRAHTNKVRAYRIYTSRGHLSLLSPEFPEICEIPKGQNRA